MLNLQGSFVPTTDVWDVTELYNSNISDDLREILIRMYLNLNRMSIVINGKDTGLYDTVNPFVNGQVYFSNPALTSQSTSTPVGRQVIRLVINFGALPNTGVKSVNHNLSPNSSYTFTRIYACASDTTGFNYIPIPYASPTLANNIELSVDSTQVTITTGSDRSSFDTCYVVVEYLTQ